MPSSNYFGFNRISLMETLHVSLALMATSGITFIAYRHPVLYERQFSPKLFTASGLILLAIIFHDIGTDSAFRELAPLLKEGTSEKAKEAIEAAATSGKAWLSVLAIFFYGLFLSWLADHMAKEYGIEKDESDEVSDS